MLAAKTSVLSREAAVEAMRTVSNRPAAIAGVRRCASARDVACAVPDALRRRAPLLRAQPCTTTGLTSASAWGSLSCAGCRCRPSSQTPTRLRCSARARSCTGTAGCSAWSACGPLGNPADRSPGRAARCGRPQTRRRRENDGSAFQRMRSLRHNMDTSRAILEWLQRRERRKRDIIQCEIDLQLLNMKLRHDARQVRLYVCRSVLLQR
jgi:hypothetical protein